MEDINTSSSFKNVLFVNSAVFSLSDYINSDTIEIGYDTHVSTIIPSAKNHNNVTRIGFAFHFSGEDDDHEAFFTDLDLGESVEFFSPNVQSMLDLLLGGGITHVDFLACGTLRSEKWKRYYQLLQSKTGVVIGASDNNTGNLLYGGDWVMESTMENIREIYFTTAIENYAHLLVADFTVGGVLYRDQGGNKLLAVNFTNSSSLTHLDLPASVTNGGITYSVTSIADGNAGNGFTKGNSTLVSMTFPNTLVTFNSFTFRLGYIREFDLTNTQMVAFPPQFAHGSQAYLLKLPNTCTSLAHDSFNNLQNNNAVSATYNYPTPIQLTLPDSITTIAVNDTPFHYAIYGDGNSYNAWNNVSLTTRKGIKLGKLIMYDRSNNYYKYVGDIPYDILWGTLNTSGTDRSQTLNNIIKGFNTSKTNTALWALIVITSVSFPDSTTLLYKLNTVIITADASNAASVRYSLNGGSDWITNTASPNTSIALPDGTYAIGAIKVICTSSDGVDSNTFTNSSAITIYLAGPIGLVVRYPSSTTLTNNKVQSVILTTLPSDAVSWSYSTNSGSTWTVRDLTSSSFVLSETLYEVNSIQVKCANDFGNFGAIDYNTSSIIFDFGYNTYHHTYYTINVTNPTVLTRTTYNNAGTVVLDTQDISFGGMPIKDVLSLMDGSGTNPYAIGIVDSSLNKICMDIAYCGVYTKPLTDRQKTKLMTYVNTTYKEPRAAASTIYTVTVRDSVYWISINGATAIRTPNLSLSMTVGNMYVFDQTDLSNLGKPLALSTTSTSPSYTTGVVSNGTPGSLNAYTLIDVTALTTFPLYYYCTNTENMGYVPPIPYTTTTSLVLGGATPVLSSSITSYLSSTNSSQTALSAIPTNGLLLGLTIDSSYNIIVPGVSSYSFYRYKASTSSTSSVEALNSLQNNNIGEIHCFGNNALYVNRNTGGMTLINLSSASFTKTNIGGTTPICTCCFDKTGNIIYALDTNCTNLKKYSGVNFGTVITIKTNLLTVVKTIGITTKSSSEVGKDSFGVNSNNLATSVRMVTDNVGNLYLFYDNVINKITVSQLSSAVSYTAYTTIAGNGTYGNISETTGLNSRLGTQIGLVCDSYDTIYFLDRVPVNSTTGSYWGTSTVNLKKLWYDSVSSVYMVGTVRTDISNTALAISIDPSNNIYIAEGYTVRKYPRE